MQEDTLRLTADGLKNPSVCFLIFLRNGVRQLHDANLYAGGMDGFVSVAGLMDLRSVSTYASSWILRFVASA